MRLVAAPGCVRAVQVLDHLVIQRLDAKGASKKGASSSLFDKVRLQDAGSPPLPWHCPVARLLTTFWPLSSPAFLPYARCRVQRVCHESPGAACPPLLRGLPSLPCSGDCLPSLARGTAFPPLLRGLPALRCPPGHCWSWLHAAAGVPCGGFRTSWPPFCGLVRRSCSRRS